MVLVSGGSRNFQRGFPFYTDVSTLLKLRPKKYKKIFILFIILFEAGEPASKVCGQPVPTARNVQLYTLIALQLLIT